MLPFLARAILALTRHARLALRIHQKDESTLWVDCRRAHGCPVRFCWTGRMAWILLRFERLAAFETRKGDHAMRHQNSVFHGLMKHVPWHKLDAVIEKYGADELARKLKTKRHLIALLYGQLRGAIGLRR